MAYAQIGISYFKEKKYEYYHFKNIYFRRTSNLLYVKKLSTDRKYPKEQEWLVYVIFDLNLEERINAVNVFIKGILPRPWTQNIKQAIQQNPQDVESCNNQATGTEIERNIFSSRAQTFYMYSRRL